MSSSSSSPATSPRSLSALADLQRLAFAGVPATARAGLWRILLGLSPLDASARPAELARKRLQYRIFLDELTTRPGENDAALPPPPALPPALPPAPPPASPAPRPAAGAAGSTLRRFGSLAARMLAVSWRGFFGGAE